MGPLLLGRLMNLNEVQEGVLNIAFNVADKEGLLLLDLDDLQSMLVHCGEQADRADAPVWQCFEAVDRRDPALAASAAQPGRRSFLRRARARTRTISSSVDDQGRGFVNILAADRLMASPRLYATFLLWLLSELFEELPEIGDPDKPKLCFFFDEAHLLFDDAPPACSRRSSRSSA